MNKEHRKHKIWLNVVVVMACIVIFITTYALILPAITQEGQSVDFTDMITSVSLQHRSNEWGSWEDVNDTPVQTHEQLRFTIDYAIPGNILSDDVRTVVYQLPNKISIVKECAGPLTDSIGREIGTYSISQEGKITITFDDEYVKRNASGNQIVGSVSFESSLDDIESDDGNIIKLPFNEKLEFTVIVGDNTSSNENLDVEKKAGAIDNKNGTIEYTITVKSTNGTGSDVTLNDAMSNIVFGGNLKVTDKNGNQVSNITVPENGTQNFVLNLPQMNAGDEYTITYTAVLADKYANGTINANNKVTVSSTGKDGNDITDQSSTGNSIQNNLISKTGQITGDEEITWTVTVNNNGMDIGGWTLSDTFNGVSFTGEVNISPDINGQNKITLPYTFSDGCKETYTITYVTNSDKKVGSSQTLNRVDLSDGDHNISSGNVGAENWGSVYNPLLKTSDSIIDNDDETATIKWIMTVNADQGDITAPFDINDELMNDQWYTQDQIDALLQNLNNALKDKNIDFVLTTVKMDNSDDKYKGFKIHFTSSVAKGESFVFSYDSTAPIGDGSTEKKFVNNSNINNIVWSNAETKYSPVKPTVKKYDNNGDESENTSHDYFDDVLNGNGVLEWQLRVTVPDDYDGEDLYLVENLPKEVNLTYLDITADGVFDTQEIKFNDTKGSVNIAGYTINAEKVGNIVHIIIPKELAVNSNLNEIRFIVRVKINDDFDWHYDDSGMASADFKNEVTLEKENGEEFNSDIQTQTISKDKYHGIVGKSNGDVKNDVIPYVLNVNPEGKDLLEGSDTIILKDEIKIELGHYQGDAYLSLVPSSLRVYDMNSDGSKGGALLLEEYPYTLSTEMQTDSWPHYEINTLSVQLPDNRPLIVEYKYKVTGSLGLQCEIFNNAWLEGSVPKMGDTSHKLSLKITGSSAVADIATATICKVDADNYNIHLKDAEFNLWEYNAQTDNWIPVSNDNGSDILVTGDDGELMVKLAYNTAYKLVEIKAPEGYEVDSKEFLFSIESSDTVKYPPSKPEYFIGKEFGEGAVIDYPNKKSVTDITVVKKWLDKDGNDMTGSKEGEIEFKLFRKITIVKEGGMKGDATLKGSILKAWSTEAYMVFDEVLPMGEENSIVIVDKSGAYWGDPPIIKINDEAITPISSTKDSAKVYTYTFTLTQPENIILGNLSKDADEYLITFGGLISQSEDEKTDDEYIGSYKINSENGWTIKLSDLPRKAEYDDGTVVSYQYYVDEVSVAGYDISYINNNGIDYGVITITNTSVQDSGYVLPETGGTGTQVYTLSGLLLITGTLMFGYKLRRKSERWADN